MIHSLITALIIVSPHGHMHAETHHCAPVVYNEARSASPRYQAGWDYLLAHGWHGRATDRQEALYAPRCA
jgi:hypothetical protein